VTPRAEVTPVPGALTPDQVTGILDVAKAAAKADGVGPLSEHGMLRVRHSEPGHGPDVVATADGHIVGYGYLDEPDPAQESEVAGELVVHPAHRRQGVGTALLGVLAEQGEQAGARAIRLWAHGDLAAAAALARSAGFERIRALWQMRRSLAEPLPELDLPAGVMLRTFRVGQDEESWLRVNGRAFAKHPEQGSWTARDLELREREPWFDPDGFLIAERGAGNDKTMIGFHWTKIHPAKGTEPSIGEVYVLGVDPDAHGGGLGSALTVAGLRYLSERGLDQVMLYVDEENSAAIRLYQGLGFTRRHTDAMYRASRVSARLAPKPPGPRLAHGLTGLTADDRGDDWRNVPVGWGWLAQRTPNGPFPLTGRSR
jgi:mycothiol synthase